jgi:hypothetical protein
MAAHTDQAPRTRPDALQAIEGSGCTGAPHGEKPGSPSASRQRDVAWGQGSAIARGRARMLSARRLVARSPLAVEAASSPAPAAEAPLDRHGPWATLWRAPQLDDLDLERWFAEISGDLAHLRARAP